MQLLLQSSQRARGRYSRQGAEFAVAATPPRARVTKRELTPLHFTFLIFHSFPIHSSSDTCINSNLPQGDDLGSPLALHQCALSSAWAPRASLVACVASPSHPPPRMAALPPPPPPPPTSEGAAGAELRLFGMSRLGNLTIVEPEGYNGTWVEGYESLDFADFISQQVSWAVVVVWPS